MLGALLAIGVAVGGPGDGDAPKCVGWGSLHYKWQPSQYQDESWDQVDWVQYYKSHGYQLNGQPLSQPPQPRYLMQWAQPTQSQGFPAYPSYPSSESGNGPEKHHRTRLIHDKQPNL